MHSLVLKRVDVRGAREAHVYLVAPAVNLFSDVQHQLSAGHCASCEADQMHAALIMQSTVPKQSVVIGA